MIIDKTQFREPVVFFANGIGDAVLALPTLRALAAIFDSGITLVCEEGPHAFIFDALPVRRRVKTSIVRRASAQPQLDVARLLPQIAGCDLFVSLVPWTSPTLETLVRALGAFSIGFFDNFSLTLPRDYSIHAVTLPFKVVALFDPGAQVTEHGAGMAPVPRPEGRMSDLLRDARGTLRFLVVHLDTQPVKMVEPELVAGILERFLARNGAYLAIVIGSARPAGIVLEAGAGRLIDATGLSLQEAFAIVAAGNLFLGIDSCMLHVADICRVPGVGLFVSTEPHEFGFFFTRAAAHVKRSGMARETFVEQAAEALDRLAADADARRPATTEAATAPVARSASSAARH